MTEKAKCFREDCNHPGSQWLKGRMYRYVQRLWNKGAPVDVELYECQDCYEKNAMRAWRSLPGGAFYEDDE